MTRNRINDASKNSVTRYLTVQTVVVSLTETISETETVIPTCTVIPPGVPHCPRIQNNNQR